MNGLGQISANSQILNQANGNGLGNVVQPQQGQQTFGRNSSLEMFELANAEKMKAKEMQFENEAMRAKGEQQRLAAESNAMRENQILEGLKNGQIDEKTAFDIFGDKNISQDVKQKVAQVMYPPTDQEMEFPTDIYDYDFYRRDGVDIGRQNFVHDNERAIAERARTEAIGKPGARNVTWDSGRELNDYITLDPARASDLMNIDETSRYR